MAAGPKARPDFENCLLEEGILTQFLSHICAAEASLWYLVFERPGAASWPQNPGGALPSSLHLPAADAAVELAVVALAVVALAAVELAAVALAVVELADSATPADVPMHSAALVAAAANSWSTDFESSVPVLPHR